MKTNSTCAPVEIEGIARCVLLIHLQEYRARIQWCDVERINTLLFKIGGNSLYKINMR